MVIFSIGPSGEQFLVHKEHPCHYSPVLRKAFNSEFLEGQTQRYTMEHVTTGTFRFFVQWLYKQKIRIGVHRSYDMNVGLLSPDDYQNHIALCGTQASDLVALWCLAEELLIPKLQDLVMDHLQEASTTCVSVLLLKVDQVYENTSDDSPLRRFFVQLGAWTLPSYHFNVNKPWYPKDFLIDVAIAFREAVPPRVADKRRSGIEARSFYVKQSSGELR